MEGDKGLKTKINRTIYLELVKYVIQYMTKVSLTLKK